MGGDGNQFGDVARMLAATVAGRLDQPARGVRELVDRARAGDRSVTVEVLVPAVEELLTAVERFTLQARGER